MAQTAHGPLSWHSTLSVRCWTFGVVPVLAVIHFVASVASAKTERLTDDIPDSSQVKYLDLIQHGRSQVAQKTVSSRDDRTSRICTGVVGRLAQGRNIRSPAALA